MAGTTGITVRIVSNKLPETARAMDAAVAAEIKRAGFEIEAAAKQKAPVRTGTLRRSIHTVISADSRRATVGPSVKYGLPVELGTRRMAARPYMRPAAEAVYPRFADRLKAALRKGG